MYNIRQSTLLAAFSGWCGNEMETVEKHYEPYTLGDDPIDGQIVESILCIETGEVFPCGPWVPLNMFESWLRSQFKPDVEVREGSLLS